MGDIEGKLDIDKNKVLEYLLENQTDTLSQIGARFGVTRERVRQIVQECGLNYEQMKRSRSEARIAERELELKEEFSLDVYALYKQKYSGEKIAEMLGLSPFTVQKLLRELFTPDERRLLVSHGSRERRSDDEVLEDMRTAFRLSKARKLTGKLYNRHRPEGSLSHVRVVQRFNTWRDACELAGVPSKPAIRRNYTRGYGEKEILEALYECQQAVGRLPTVNDYENWAKGKPVPSLTIIRIRLGTWVQILERLEEWKKMHRSKLE